MVWTRLSSKHGFAPSKPLMETLSFQSSGGINTCSSVSNRSPQRGVRMFSLCVCVCSCASARSGKGYSNICGLSFDPAALKHSTTHSCLVLRFPHLCYGSNITAHSASICCRQGTLPCTSLGVHNASCLTHLQSPSLSSEITPSLLMSDMDS